MGIYSDNLEREVRLERMRPAQIDEAKAHCPAVYVPFGAIEWHGRHNPVGLDAIKAHEQLVGLAARAGGVVYPPVYLGSGGGHTQWPHSYMVDSGPMKTVVTQLLQGFQRDGYAAAVLISGHYPNKGKYLDDAIDAYRDAGGTMRVLAVIESSIPGGEGDHAALYETSSMLYLDPSTVDREALTGELEPGADGTARNWMGSEHVSHACYGLVGIDPRGRASEEIGGVTTENLIAHLEKWVEEQ